jgi:hypothetical protein
MKHKTKHQLLAGLLFAAVWLGTGCKKESNSPVAEPAPLTATTPAVTEALFPHQVLNLTNWKLTLPVDYDANGIADEIKQPQLSTYSLPPYFCTTPGGTAVTFRAYAGGATTSGSGYPRCELREMTSNGSQEAKWSSSVGTHTMEIDQVVLSLPVQKPEMVVGQIHNSSDDIVVFRLEGSKLYVNVNGKNKTPAVTDNYVPGTRFTVKFVVAANQTYCYYNGVLKYTLSKTYSNAFFKAGAYIQSACKGPKAVPGELCTASGAVDIYRVTVTHN